MSSVQKRLHQRFHDHLQQLAVQKKRGGRDGFDAELKRLNKVDETVRSNLDEFYTSSLGTSSAKNRFADVRANETTMVRLQPVSDHGGGTYINANYVDGREELGVPFVYIATQAPLKNTVVDFWRMVFENGAAFVVMLCAKVESEKAKSARYWPEFQEELELDVLTVRTVAERRLHGVVYRTIRLRSARGVEQTVTHMQYTAWPDQGIPESSASLMEVIQEIGKSSLSVDAPIVVHCSGGVGRTGVFIAMHVALAQFQLERKSISIPSIVHFLKLCRSGMVQRKDQYLFLCYAVEREMKRMIWSAERGVNLLEASPTQPERLANSQALPPRPGGARGDRPHPAVEGRVYEWPAAPAAQRAAGGNAPPSAGRGARRPTGEPVDEVGLMKAYLARTSGEVREPAANSPPVAGRQPRTWPQNPAAHHKRLSVEEALEDLQDQNRRVRVSPSMHARPLASSRSSDVGPAAAPYEVEQASCLYAQNWPAGGSVSQPGSDFGAAIGKDNDAARAAAAWRAGSDQAPPVPPPRERTVSSKSGGDPVSKTAVDGNGFIASESVESRKAVRLTKEELAML